MKKATVMQALYVGAVAALCFLTSCGTGVPSEAFVRLRNGAIVQAYRVRGDERMFAKGDTVCVCANDLGTFHLDNTGIMTEEGGCKIGTVK